MTDTTNQIEEMLWRRLDGELSEAETRRLMDALAGSPEAARLESEVAELYQQLASIESEAPPAELAERIRSRIADRPVESAEGRGGVVDWSGWFRRSFASAPVLRYAAAAVLVIVVIVGYQLSSGRHGQVGDSSRYTGTISAEQAAPAVHVSLGAAGDIAVSRQGDDARLSVNLTAPATIELRVAGSGAGVRFVGAEPFTGSEPQAMPRSVAWSLQGPGHFVLTVRPLEWDQRLALGATVNGRPVAQQQIELGDLPR